MEEVPRPRARQPRAKSGDKPKPETGTTGTTESQGTVTRTPADAKLRESLVSMYQGVGMLAFGVGMPRAMSTGDNRLLALSNTLTEPKRVQDGETGEVIIVDPRTGAEAIADAWMTAADRNAKIKAALRKFTEGGAIAEVIALHVALLYPFLPGIPGLSALTSTPPVDGNVTG